MINLQICPHRFNKTIKKGRLPAIRGDSLRTQGLVVATATTAMVAAAVLVDLGVLHFENFGNHSRKGVFVCPYSVTGFSGYAYITMKVA